MKIMTKFFESTDKNFSACFLQGFGGCHNGRLALFYKKNYKKEIKGI